MGVLLLQVHDLLLCCAVLAAQLCTALLGSLPLLLQLRVGCLPLLQSGRHLGSVMPLQLGLRQLRLQVTDLLLDTLSLRSAWKLVSARGPAQSEPAATCLLHRRAGNRHALGQAEIHSHHNQCH